MDEGKKQRCPATAMQVARGRYSSYSFPTAALVGGELPASRPGAALTPGKGPTVPLDRRLGGPQSRSGHRGWRKILSHVRFPW
jgi:hypothetical protein